MALDQAQAFHLPEAEKQGRIRAFDIIRLHRPIEEGAEEILKKRGRHTKVYRLPDGRQRMVGDIMPLHYWSEDQQWWEDVDLTPYDRGDWLYFSPGVYQLWVRKDPARIEYVNGQGQRFIMEPEDFGLLAGVHRMEDSVMDWEAPGTGLSVRLNIWPYRIRADTIIQRESAAHRFRWRYEVPEQSASALDLTDGGIDNRRRRAEVFSREISSSDKEGRKEIVKEIEVTGRTLRYTEKRKKEWVSDVQYPVVVRD